LTTETADLRDYLRPIWQRKWLILFVLAAVTAGTYLYYENKPNQYRSSAKIFVEASSVDRILFGGTAFRDDRNTQNQATLLRTTEAAENVAKKLGTGDSPGSLLASVTVTAEGGTDFVNVVATAGSAQKAADIANGFAQAFIDLRSQSVRDKAKQARTVAERELETVPQGQAFRTRRDDLRGQIGRLRVIEGIPTGGAEIVEAAQPAGSPFAPTPTKNAVFGFALALLFGVSAAFALERFDRRLKRPEDIGPAYGATLLSALPHEDESAPMLDGENVLTGSFKESFRGLRTNLQLATLDRPVKSLLVTSAIPGEGKSTTTRNLALAYFEWGLNIVVVDCDLRRPNLSKLFNVKPKAGLTQVLTGEKTLEEALTPVPVNARALETLEQMARSRHAGNGAPVGSSQSVERSTSAGGETQTNGSSEQSRPGITLLHAGPFPANPQAVLASRQTEEILDQLKARFDLVILDSPPLLAVSDAVPLIPQVDGVVIVARVNQTTRDAAKRLQDLLIRSKASLIGVVANDLPQMELMGGGYTYYGYRYGASYGRARKDAAARRKREAEEAAEREAAGRS
jgi:succinoglycan biosynthesis transport protein ExoP